MGGKYVCHKWKTRRKDKKVTHRHAVAVAAARRAGRDVCGPAGVIVAGSSDNEVYLPPMSVAQAKPQN